MGELGVVARAHFKPVYCSQTNDLIVVTSMTTQPTLGDLRTVWIALLGLKMCDLDALLAVVEDIWQNSPAMAMVSVASM